MNYRILCDFDGTIALADVTDLLLESFAEPSWQEIEAQWRTGLIGSADCMARQIALLRCRHEALDTRLDTIRIDPGFSDFVAFCRREQIPLSIVSDGLDYAITRILARAGIAGLPIVANRLRFLGGDRYALESPHTHDDCLSASGTCKCQMLGTGGFGAYNILIGDGRSDFCAAGNADFVFAKDCLLDHCQKQGIPHQAFKSFSHLARLLTQGGALSVAVRQCPVVA